MVIEAEVDVCLFVCFWNSLAFSRIQWIFAIWSVSSVFYKSRSNIWSSQFTYCWSQAWRIVSITLVRVQYVCHCAAAWTFFGIASLGIGMKTDLFQSCGDWWVFQICWNIECSTLAASWFRIWNSSAGIPSPPLAHLTSDCRVSLFRLMITPSWLSGSWRSFFCIVLLYILTTS